MAASAIWSLMGEVDLTGSRESPSRWASSGHMPDDSLRSDRVELHGAIEDLRDAIADRGAPAAPVADESLAAHRAGHPTPVDPA